MAKIWEAEVPTSEGGLDPRLEAFLSSARVDARLLPQDLRASRAHAAMLGRAGVIPEAASAALVAELGRMLDEALEGVLVADPAEEDVHSFIEAELSRRLGDIGRAVHAGRSRNDQVAVAFRLFVIDAVRDLDGRVKRAVSALLDLAQAHVRTIMPGYTHLQRAQPVTLAHHLLAWCAGLERDSNRLADAAARASECPLGSGALAGSGLPIDREDTAEALGFGRPSRNTMDAVADRDFCVEAAAAAAMIMTRLSRACEDIVLWASAEYGFARIGSSASTGSSIMPQKRNPDPAELIRGKSARVQGDLAALLTLQKGLAYAYDRDLQEDKELFFDAYDTTAASLEAFALLVAAIEPDAARMREAAERGFLEATDVAELLVTKGLPFRRAYAAAKAVVALCAARGARPAELDLEELRAAHPDLAKVALGRGELAAYLDLEACVERRAQTGGPAPARTREEIARLRAWAQAR
jgi:argininosuccinate lyase